MNTWVYSGVRLVHILAAAVWIGGPLVVALQTRPAFALGPAPALALVRWLQRVTPLFIAAALTTLVTGGVLVYAWGLSATPWRIWVGLGLTLGIMFLGGGLNRPALVKLEAHLAGGGDVASAEPLVRRFLFAHRAEQALRLTALALMVLKF